MSAIVVVAVAVAAAGWTAVGVVVKRAAENNRGAERHSQK